jgi:hypothetical protein
MLATATAVTVGLGSVLAMGIGAHRGPLVHHDGAKTAGLRSIAHAETRIGAHTRHSDAAPRRQDPQDRPGTFAHRRAGRELATHRALQHVPWRRGDVTVELVGARDGRAVLRVEAPGIATARRGYHVFLRRFHDDGRAYLPRFATRRAG